MDELQRLRLRASRSPTDPWPHVELARALLAAGREEEARRVVLTRRVMPSHDPAVHTAWAELCEQVGAARPALESWERALALDRTNPHYLWRVGLLHYEAGRCEKALRHLRLCLATGRAPEPARQLLAQLYEELGERGAARALRGREPVDAPPSAAPGLEDARRLMELFRGHPGVHFRQELDAAGRAVLREVPEPLRPELVLEHLRGSITLGFEPAREDDAVRVCAIQLRISGRALRRNWRQPSYLDFLEERIGELALQLVGSLEERAIPCWVTDGAERNRLVWLFLEGFVPRRRVEGLLGELIARLPPPTGEVLIEAMAGGRPLLMPLGLNRRTGRRMSLLDREGRPRGDPLVWLRRARPARLEQLESLVRGLREEPTVRGRGPGMPAVLEPLVRGCPVVEELVRRARAGRSLTWEERLVLFHTVGLLPEGGREALHWVLELTPEYRPQRLERALQRLRPHPISCPKVRELLPRLTAYLECDCPLRVPPGGYPSPLLHCAPQLVEGARERGVLESGSLQELARRYLRLRRELEALQDSLRRVEGRLRQAFQEAGLRSLSTPYGRLRMVEGAEGVRWEVEDRA